MKNSDTTPTVPAKFSGQWIAWDFDETKIVAAGDTYAAAKQSALNTGRVSPVLVKAPLADTRFIGGHR
jgi:hypothetical protein